MALNRPAAAPGGVCRLSAPRQQKGTWTAKQALQAATMARGRCLCGSAAYGARIPG
ncbi:MAG: hypothetical protein ACPIOQ_75130 [Promethearchaeia archaeon]